MEVAKEKFLDHLAKLEVTIDPEAVWTRLEDVGETVGKGSTVKKACKLHGLELSVIRKYWMLDVKYQGYRFRDLFPTLKSK